MGLCGFGAGLGRMPCSAAGARSDAAHCAQGRAGAGQHGEDGDNGAGAGGHVGDGHDELGLGELDNQLAPAAEGNEGKR